jgi:hypothetical protein
MLKESAENMPGALRACSASASPPPARGRPPVRPSTRGKIGDRIFGKSADEFFTAPNLPKIFYNGGIFIFSFIIIYYPLDFSTTGEFL